MLRLHCKNLYAHSILLSFAIGILTLLTGYQAIPKDFHGDFLVNFWLNQVNLEHCHYSDCNKCTCRAPLQ